MRTEIQNPSTGAAPRPKMPWKARQCWTLFLGLLYTALATAAPGDRSLTYGTAGVVRDGSSVHFDGGQRVIATADGKVVMAGFRRASSGGDVNPKFSVWRFNGDGSRDPGFGPGGSGQAVLVSPDNANDSVGAALVQPDGKVIVAGRRIAPTLTNNQPEWLVMRLTAAGNLDVNFGGNGTRQYVIQSGSPLQSIESIARQADGKLLFGGYPNALMRTDANGIADASFGTAGIVRPPFDGAVQGIAVLADGRILVAGNVAGTTPGIAVLRYQADGTPDATFGNAGQFLMAGAFTATSLALQPDGGILLGFKDHFNGGTAFRAARLTPGGTLDSAFGSSGIAAAALANSTFHMPARNIPVAADGGFVLGGTGPAGGFAAARFTAAGQPHPSLGGFAGLPLGLGGNGDDLTLDASGRVLITGTVTIAGNEAVVLRLAADGSLDPTFNDLASGRAGVALAAVCAPSVAESAAGSPDGGLVVGGGGGACGGGLAYVVKIDAAGHTDINFNAAFTPGTAQVNFPGNATRVQAVAVQPDGRIVVGASIGTGPARDFALARFHADGTLDASFAGGSVVHAASAIGDELLVLAVQADGRILAGGRAGNDGVVARFNANGTLDTGFGGGQVIIPGARVDALVALADGSVLAGIVSAANASVIMKFAPTGAADVAFGSGGSVTAAEPGGVQGIAVMGDGSIVAGGAGWIHKWSAGGQPLPFAGGSQPPAVKGIAATSGNRVVVLTTGGSGGARLLRYLPGGPDDPGFAASEPLAGIIGSGAMALVNVDSHLLVAGAKVADGYVPVAKVDNTVVLSPPSTPDLDIGSDTGVSTSDNLTRITTPTFTGTCLGNGSVRLNVDAVAALPEVACVNGTYAITLAQALTPGMHAITAVDGGGQSGALNIVVDTTPPTVGISAGPPAMTAGTTALFSISAEAGANLTCTVDQAPGTACGAEHSVTLSPGMHTFTVTAFDAAGNSATTAPHAWTIVSGIATTLTLGGDVSTPLGGSAIITAQVAHASGSAAPGGTIRFRQGSRIFCSLPVPGDAPVSCPVTPDNLAPVTVIVEYFGDATYQGSSGQRRITVTAAGEGYQVGNLVPNFSLRDQDGVVRNLRDYAGKFVLLDFCTVWCVFCQQMGYDAARIRQAYGTQLEYLTVVMESATPGVVSNAADAQEWLAEHPNFGTILHRDGQADPNLTAPEAQFFYSLFASDAFPTLVILGPDQRMRHKSQGGGTADQLVALISANTTLPAPALPVNFRSSGITAGHLALSVGGSTVFDYQGPLDGPLPAQSGYQPYFSSPTENTGADRYDESIDIQLERASPFDPAQSIALSLTGLTFADGRARDTRSATAFVVLGNENGSQSFPIGTATFNGSTISIPAFTLNSFTLHPDFGTINNQTFIGVRVSRVMDLNFTQPATLPAGFATVSVARIGLGSGSVSGSGINCPGTCAVSLLQGTVVSLTATPAADSLFSGWSGACTGTGTCTFTAGLNATAVANFALINPPTFPVTADIGPNGSVTPATVNVVAGNTATFTVTPAAGFLASAFSDDCDGNFGSGANANVYTTAPVTSPCTVHFGFLRGTVVTASAGANGSISPAGPQLVTRGLAATFSVTPAPGFVATVGGTCGGQLAGNTYTTEPAFADCTVIASFVQGVRYIVTTTAASGAGSWSAALQDLNNNQCNAPVKRIDFNIPMSDPGCNGATGVCVVQLEFFNGRNISCPNVTVDGYSQPGAVANSEALPFNNAELKIEFAGTDSFIINHDNVTMRGIAFAAVPLALQVHNVFGAGLVPTSGTVIAGNYFGWRANGTTAVAGTNGPRISVNNGQSVAVTGTRIGGSAAADMNLITHTGLGDGVQLASASGTVIEGNVFNLDRNAEPGPAGTTNGISSVFGSNAGNMVRGNFIGFTRDSGVECTAGQGLTLTRNRIQDVNRSMQAHPRAIRFLPGCNGDIAAPAITNVAYGNPTMVSGTYAGAPNETYRIEFFFNGTPDTGNLGRGEEYLDSLDISTDAGGNASFSKALPGVLNVSATATRLSTGDTSTFSAAHQTPQFTVTVTKTGGTTGRVTSAPDAIDCGSTCSAAFPAGSTVQMAAFVSSGVVFLGWSGDCTGSQCNLAMDGNKHVTANYAAAMPAFTVTEPAGPHHFDAISGNFSAPRAFRITSTGNAPARNFSASVANLGEFWLVNSFCPAALAPGQGCDIEVIFAPPAGTTRVGVATTLTFTSSNAGQAAAIAIGGQVDWATITATPAQLGFSTVAGTPSAPQTVTFTAATGGVANVAIKLATSPFQVTDDHCTGLSLALGESCTVSVRYAPVDPGGNGQPLNVEVDANFNGSFSRAVLGSAQLGGTASFPPAPATITVTTGGNGFGRMVSTPAGIDCPGTCSAPFPLGTTVTLTPVPAANSYFLGYAGCPQPGVLDTPCTFTADGNKNIYTEFRRATVVLTVNKAGLGSGTVTGGPIDCGTTCTATVPYGPSVTLSATAAPGSRFRGFIGAGCPAEGSCNAGTGDDNTVTAVFDLDAPGFTITNTNISGPGSFMGALSTIYDAAGNFCLPGLKTIAFNIPAATDPGCNPATGICVVQIPESTTIRCADIVIDGYTQPGAAPNTATDRTNNAAIRIEFDGPSASGQRSVVIGRAHTHPFGSHTANNVTLRGLAFPRHRLEILAGHSGSVLGGGSGHVVAGNVFGWHADGTRAMGQVSFGINMFGAYLSQLAIGGPAPADRNLLTFRDVAHCCEAGSRGINGEGIGNSIIEGNYINIGRDGQAVASNGVVTGIGLSGGLSGGTPYSAHNIVRRNVLANLFSTPINTGGGDHNTVTENLVFGHPAHLPPINFFSPAAGGSNPQLAPVVTAVTLLPGGVQVTGTVTGDAHGTIRLEFFSNATASTDSGGAADTFHGHLDVVMDAGGTGSFSHMLPAAVRHVGVTATRLSTGDTSMFSRYVAPAAPPMATLTVFNLPAGNGRITGNGIDCEGGTGGPGGTGANCIASLPAGTSVTLTAAPGPGMFFQGWATGFPEKCPAAPLTCSFTITANTTVSTGFAATDTAAPIARLDGPTVVDTLVPFTVDAGASVDIGGSIASYEFSAMEKPAGSNLLPMHVEQATPILTLTADKAGNYRIGVRVRDQAGNVSSFASVVPIALDKTPPVAVITLPAVGVLHQAAALSAAASTDAGGGSGAIPTYIWSVSQRPAGGTASIVASAGTPSATLTPDAVGDWVIRLQVLDAAGNPSAAVFATLRVNAMADTIAPVAIIEGTLTGKINLPVNLSGAASQDLGGQVVEYQWSVNPPRDSRRSFPPVIGSAPAFSFMPDVIGIYSVSLRVRDDSGNLSLSTRALVRISDSDAPVAVLVADPNPAPVNQYLLLDTSLSFDVGGSGIHSVSLTEVSRPPGAQPLAATLRSRAGGGREFMPDRAGKWQVQVTARDNAGLTSQPYVTTITVIESSRPTAVIEGKTATRFLPDRLTVTTDGEFTGRIETAVELFASQSASGAGPIVEYQWRVTDTPRGSQIARPQVNGPSPDFSFVPDVIGIYRVRLVVVDDKGVASNEATALVLVRDTENPVAVLAALPSPVVVNGTVMLDARDAFDVGGAGIHSYSFSVSQRPPGSVAEPVPGNIAGPAAALPNPRTPISALVPDRPGTWRVQLVLRDGVGNMSVPDTLVLPVYTNAGKPTAIIDGPATGRGGVPLVFDASLSGGTASPVTKYSWSLAFAPRASNLPLNVVTQSATPAFTFTADSIGRYRLKLVVTNSDGADSDPEFATLDIADTDAPVAVLAVTPSPALAGQVVTLSAVDSFDVGGAGMDQLVLSVVARPTGSHAMDTQVVMRNGQRLHTFIPDLPGAWRFRLVARDFRGNVSTPDEVSLAVFPGVPAPPADVTATPGVLSAVIGFTPAGNGGSAITGFTATCRLGALAASAGGSASPITVSGLSAGTWQCEVTASNAGGTSLPSASASVTPIVPLTLDGVVSRKTHGSGAGTFDVVVDRAASILGDVTVEPRVEPSGRHRLVFSFSEPVLSVGDVTVRDKLQAPAGNATHVIAGNTVIVTLSNIVDASRVTVRLVDVNGPQDFFVSMGFLAGDVSGNGTVSAADLSAARARSGLANATTFRADVNVNGTIDTVDQALVRARSGRSLP